MLLAFVKHLYLEGTYFVANGEDMFYSASCITMIWGEAEHWYGFWNRVHACMGRPSKHFQFSSKKATFISEACDKLTAEHLIIAIHMVEMRIVLKQIMQKCKVGLEDRYCVIVRFWKFGEAFVKKKKKKFVEVNKKHLLKKNIF